jgi:hypothetical protein
VINNQKVITATPIVDTKNAIKTTTKTNPLWYVLPLLLLAVGIGLAWLVKNNKFDFPNPFSQSSTIAIQDTVPFINKDSVELAKANDTITKEFAEEKKSIEAISPEQKDDFADVPTKELKNETKSNSSASENFASKSSSVRKSSRNSKEDISIETTSSSKSQSSDPAKEEQNYNALLQQKEKWVIIKSDLEALVSSGNTVAAERLKNSESVLRRIEKKLNESAKKLGKN